MYFETEEERQSAAVTLQQLGGHARNLLAECVEHQGLERAALSKAAQALSDAGFVFVREKGSFFERIFHLAPTLAGEEALEVLDQIDDKKKANKKSAKP